MTEKQLQYIAVPIKLLAIAIFGMLYSMGGYSVIELRRWVAPAVLLACVAAFKKTWNVKFIAALCISYALYVITLSLPYGTSIPLPDLVKRFIWGGLVSASCVTLVAYCKRWWMLGLQASFGALTSMFYGSFHPIHGREEEALIAICLICFVPFMYDRDEN